MTSVSGPPSAADRAVLTRGHKQRERTRRRLVAAAVEVIGERGEAFSIGDVTQRAGVSNGTFYNYFDDRAALVDGMVPEVLADFAATSAASVSDDDPAVRFATITALVLRRAVTDPGRMRALVRLDAVYDAIVDGRALGHLRDDLAAGAASGRFDVDPDDAIVDVVVGTQLLAVRRIVDQRAAPGFESRVVARLLGALGLGGAEADAIARDAVNAAALITDPG